MTSSLRLATLAFSLAAALTPHVASADEALPPFSLGIPNAGNLFGLQLNQWFVINNEVTAGTIIDGSLGDKGSTKDFPTADQLERSVSDSQGANDKLASSYARIGATSLGASASAFVPLNSTGTSSIAVGHAYVGYWAVLDQNTTFQFDLKLDGHLATSGDRALGTDRSGAAVTAFAFGSDHGFSGENSFLMFQNAGLGAAKDGGDAWLQQLISAHSSTQTYLDVYGQQSDSTQRSLDVDTTLHVSASGALIECGGTFSSPVCGRYFYMVGVFLFTGAQNGGSADFSHTLQITGMSTDGGAVQPFNAISAVPEPATQALLLAGLLAVGGIATRRARQIP